MILVERSTNRNIVLLGIIIALFSYILATFIVKLLTSFTSLSAENILLSSRLLLWLFFAVICFYSMKVEQQPIILWKEHKYSFGVYILSVMAVVGALFFGLMIIVAIVKMIGLPLGNSKRLEELMPIFKRNKFLLVFTALTAGITEELIFRAYLMPRLQLFFKQPYMPIIVSSLLFALMHITYGTLMQVLGPFYIGTVFGFYYYKFRNIKVLIACHFFWDLFSLLVKTH
jgi:membrane protease YdiL (CAAX protease family)